MLTIIRLITAPLRINSDPVMRTMDFIPNTVSETTAAAARSSGRETLCRVAAGAVAKKILAELGIEICAYTVSIGPVSIDRNNMDISKRFDNPLIMPDPIAAQKASEYLDKCMSEGDSAGGIAECVIKGVPAGIGEPVFDKLDAVLGMAILSIGAVKGIEFGSGFAVSEMKGSENNDPFIAENGKVKKLTNNSGGILGGISDGSDIIFRACIQAYTFHIQKTAYG